MRIMGIGDDVRRQMEKALNAAMGDDARGLQRALDCLSESCKGGDAAAARAGSSARCGNTTPGRPRPSSTKEHAPKKHSQLGRWSWARRRPGAASMDPMVRSPVPVPDLSSWVISLGRSQ